MTSQGGFLLSIDRISGKLLILVGIGFLVMGTLAMSSISSEVQYPWASPVGFFVGVMLVGTGFLIQLDFYSTRSLFGKFGSALVTSALPFFAGVFVSVTYSELVGYSSKTVIFRGAILGYDLVPILAYPFSWAAFPLLIAGVSLAVFGIGLRVLSEFF
jgi:hypothetical protein